MTELRRVGPYQLLDLVASGGMAEVYRARKFEQDGGVSLVALKRVLERYADDPGFHKMLIAEYHLSALLEHPNIARIDELLRTSAGTFIVMELVDGKDLRSTIARCLEYNRFMDVGDAVYVMARALDGLHFAHSASTQDGRPLELVHRDFSPSNILLGYDGSVKIIDFGIAKAMVDRERTQIGVIKGKVRYMSPEQANGDQRLTGQSDVFSAGSVLYEMLSGVPAFSAATELDLIYTVRRARPVPLGDVAPHVPAGLLAIVEHAMQRARSSRYASAAEFRDELVTFLRAWAPGYRRTRLANFLRTLWESEIEAELRALLAYAVADGPSEATENLLAKASLEDSISAARQALLPDQSTTGSQGGLRALSADDAEELPGDFDKLPPTVPKFKRPNR